MRWIRVGASENCTCPASKQLVPTADIGGRRGGVKTGWGQARIAHALPAGGWCPLLADGGTRERGLGLGWDIEGLERHAE